MHKRTIIGVQIHHSTLMNDAYRGLVNGAQGLKGTLSCSGDPYHEELVNEAVALVRRVGRAQEAAAERLHKLWEEDPDKFIRCREGAEPWPDETVGGFQARCTCSDICQIHDNGNETPGWVCKCRPCPAHPEVKRNVPDN